MYVFAKKYLAHLIDDQDQPIAQQDLGQMIAADETFDEGFLKNQAQQKGDGHAANQGKGETASVAGDPVSEIGAQHVEGTMGEVDDAEDAEDKRQAARHKEQDQPVLNRVQKLNRECGDIHHLIPCGGSARRGGGGLSGCRKQGRADLPCLALKPFRRGNRGQDRQHSCRQPRQVRYVRYAPRACKCPGSGCWPC